jgi:hypothetical protein
MCSQGQLSVGVKRRYNFEACHRHVNLLIHACLDWIACSNCAGQNDNLMTMCDDDVRAARVTGKALQSVSFSSS